MSADRSLLFEIKQQLYRWAEESRKGGWSTHQVEPMERLATTIDKHLALKDEADERAEREAWIEGLRGDACRY